MSDPVIEDPRMDSEHEFMNYMDALLNTIEESKIDRSFAITHREP